jgi:hypothetical protein
MRNDVRRLQATQAFPDSDAIQCEIDDFLLRSYTSNEINPAIEECEVHGRVVALSYRWGDEDDLDVVHRSCDGLGKISVYSSAQKRRASAWTVLKPAFPPNIEVLLARRKVLVFFEL